MGGYTITDGIIDIDLNATDYFETVLLNMIFGFISNTETDLNGNLLKSYPKSVHNLANIASGNGTIGSLVPFTKNASITNDLINKIKDACKDALVEIQQNGDIDSFDVQINRQNNELEFVFTLNIQDSSIFYNYVYNMTTGAFAKLS